MGQRFRDRISAHAHAALTWCLHVFLFFLLSAAQDYAKEETINRQDLLTRQAAVLK